MKQQQMLKCFYTNADSLVNKFPEFQARVKASNCMIVGITEVKPKHQRFLVNPAELKIDGYEMYHCNIGDVRGRGVILYVHNLLESSPMLALNSDFQESVWVEIRLNKNDSLLVGVIYRSPGSTDQNNLYLNGLITEAVQSKNSHFLLLGDFNYPSINWEACSTDSTVGADYIFLQNIGKNYLFQQVTRPTRARVGNQSNILDLVFTNEEGMTDDISHESPLGKSDHCYTIDYLIYGYTI